MPPFLRQRLEAFRHHRVPQDLPGGAFSGGAAVVVGIGAAGHLVVAAGHGHRLARMEIIQRQIDRAAPVVTGAGGGIADELVLVGRCRIPEQFGHIPGSVAVKDHQTVALRPQMFLHTYQCLGGRSFEKGMGRGIDGLPEEIAGRGIADIESEQRRQGGEIHKIGLAQGVRLGRWRGRLGFPHQLGDGTDRGDAENLGHGRLPGRCGGGSHEATEEGEGRKAGRSFPVRSVLMTFHVAMLAEKTLSRQEAANRGRDWSAMVRGRIRNGRQNRSIFSAGNIMRLLRPASAVLLGLMTLLSRSAAAAPTLSSLPAGVPDYLTEVSGAQALDWVEAQNRRTLGTLESDPRYAGFYADALEVGESQDRLAKPRFLGGHIWNFWQDAHHPRGIWRQTTLASYRALLTSWVTKLDVDELARRENANWVFEGADCLRPRERYCLVALSEGGEDAQTLREYDSQAGLFVRNGFVLPRSKQSAAWIDRDTLLVGRDWDGTGETLTASGYPFVVKRLGRGQRPDQAIEVARGAKDDVAVEPVVLTDGEGHQLVLIRRSPTFFTSRYAVLESMDPMFHGERPGTLHWLALPERTELQGLLHGRLILTLNEEWVLPEGRKIPAGSLVSVDPAAVDRNVDVLHTPSPGQALDEVAVTRDTVVVTYFENVRGHAMVLRTPPTAGNAWTREVMPLPDMATVHVAGADTMSNAVFLTVEGFLDPPQLWLVGDSPAGAEKIRQAKALFDASALAVEQLWATSTDGTRIPYFLVRPKGMTRDGHTPVLLTAYGGFQASYTPLYAPEIGRLWLKQGGAYAVANIRGGGEFGPAWHEAGRKAGRQHVYDDFAAVGRDLVSRGVTSVAHLGIRGRSNGGLLMGVEFTRHPDLWNAVVIGVPLLDMLHYETLAAGASWADEYGSVAVPAERRFLEAWSPLQHLRPEISYPMPFIFTATTDDRVGPVHARRFAARLESLGKPFLYYEDTEGGHSGTVNAREVAHERALEAVYFSRQLMAPLH